MKCLCCDIGGSNIKYAVMDSGLKIQGKGRCVTPQKNLEELIEVIGSLYDEFRGEISGLAVSMPGMIDSRSGVAYTGGSLSYIHNINMAETLQKRCPLPVTVENDAKCAAIAEVTYGSLRGVRDGVALILGTGVGGAIVLDGKVRSGSHLVAGEFSNIRCNRSALFDFDNCWGNVSGIRRVLEKGRALRENQKEFDGEQFFKLVVQGDRQMQEILDEFTLDLAGQIWNLQFILDPEKFVIGGGISVQQSLFDFLQKNLKRLYATFPFALPRPVIEPCKFFNDSNLIGAWCIWVQKYAGSCYTPIRVSYEEAADK